MVIYIQVEDGSVPYTPPPHFPTRPRHNASRVFHGLPPPVIRPCPLLQHTDNLSTFTICQWSWSKPLSSPRSLSPSLISPPPVSVSSKETPPSGHRPPVTHPPDHELSPPERPEPTCERMCVLENGHVHYDNGILSVRFVI